MNLRHKPNAEVATGAAATEEEAGVRGQDPTAVPPIRGNGSHHAVGDPIQRPAPEQRWTPIKRRRAPHRGNVLLNGAVALSLFSLVLALQFYDHAFRGEFGDYPDEAAHYVTGLMFHDYFAGLRYLHPFQFAENFYLHYPKVAIGHWPPVFYILQSLWTLVFSTSHTSLMFLMAVLTTLLGFTLYRALAGKVGLLISAVAAAVLLALPVVQKQAGMVMADVPVALFSLLAALCFARFLETERARDVLAFGALSTIAILTKGSAFSLALLPPVAIALTRKWRLLRRPALWASAGVVALLCGPWYWFTLRMANAGGWARPHPALGYSIHAVSFYLLELLRVPGWGLAMLVAVGCVVAITDLHRAPERNGFWAALIALFAGYVALFCIVPAGHEARYILPAIPAELAWAAEGAKFMAERLRSRRWRPLASCVLIGEAFLATGLRFPRLHNYGFGSVASFLVSQPSLHHSVFLVSSDALGEGMTVAQVAMRDHRPDHVVLRASQTLASSDWSGGSFHLLYKNPRQVENFLQSVPVRAIVLDSSAAGALPRAERSLLDATLKQYAGDWMLASSFPVWRKGVKFKRTIRVYLSTAQPQRATVIRIDMRHTLGKTLTLRLKGSPAQRAHSGPRLLPLPAKPH